MIIWTPAVLSVLYECVLYFCICTCSAQLSIFHMEKRSRNMLIIIILLLSFELCLALHKPEQTRAMGYCEINGSCFNPSNYRTAHGKRRPVCRCEHSDNQVSKTDSTLTLLNLFSLLRRPRKQRQKEKLSDTERQTERER